MAGNQRHRAHRTTQEGNSNGYLHTAAIGQCSEAKLRTPAEIWNALSAVAARLGAVTESDYEGSKMKGNRRRDEAIADGYQYDHPE